LKVWILDFGLEVNPRNHLRNGHLHNMISTSVTRSKHHGDGIETQSSPESVRFQSCDRNPPGPRRLRFPSFKFNCQRANSRTQILPGGEPPGFFETTEALPVGPVWILRVSRI
jgi:hypothetical protein